MKKETDGKAPLWRYLSTVNLAIEAMAKRAEMGHKKYEETDRDWDNFKSVPDGSAEYMDAQMRHMLGLSPPDTQGLSDIDLMIEDLTANAWGAVAALQVILEKYGENTNAESFNNYRKKILHEEEGKDSTVLRRESGSQQKAIGIPKKIQQKRKGTRKKTGARTNQNKS